MDLQDPKEKEVPKVRQDLQVHRVQEVRLEKQEVRDLVVQQAPEGQQVKEDQLVKLARQVTAVIREKEELLDSLDRLERLVQLE